MSHSLQVAGYDKETDRLFVSHPVPRELLGIARRLAHVKSDDDGEGAYPLDAAAATALGLQMATRLNSDLYDWFLEPAQSD